MYSIEELDQVRDAARRLTEPYPDPERPGCWRVTVGCRVDPLEAIIDEESLPLVQGRRWTWAPGSRHGQGSVVLGGVRGARPPLHQVIMGVRGAKFRVGHLNGDPLDCRRENLVVRTPSEQAVAARKMTSKSGRPCSSRFKGVQCVESGRKWSAQIGGKSVGGKVVQLGRFRSEIDAALAYDAAARELHGEHARLNFPDPAEAQRQRALETPVPPLYATFPPPGMVDRDDACNMFGVSLTTWTVWEQKGRIQCGQFFPLPDDKPGRCKLYPVAELERLREEISLLGKPYPDPDRPGIWRVPLKGYLDYREAMIDAESLPIVAGRNWNWAPRPDAIGGGQVVLATVTGPAEPLARLVVGATRSEQRVTHANGDPLDCTRANLFVKSLQEQIYGNRKMRSMAGRELTSRFKGVCWDPNRELWKAQIRKDGKGGFIGRFDDEIEAALAYDAKARELFGEHAWLNFPEMGERGRRVSSDGDQTTRLAA